MAELLARLEEFISRYCMWRPGQRIGIAVSGGADSVCLFHLLRELSCRQSLDLHLVHVDHGLRGVESEEDRLFVETLGRAHGVPVHVERVDLSSGEGNLEQAGREARYSFFLRLLSGHVIHRLATAHTQSDQAETVLYRLLRGSGTEGLAGIRPFAAPGIVRPLLFASRAEIAAFLKDRGYSWREDSSNSVLSFDRNRIRHELLPQLTVQWNAALPAALSRTALLAQEDEAYWQHEISRIAGRLFDIRREAVLFRTGPVATVPLAVQRRLLRWAIERVKGDLRGLDFDHIEALRQLLTSQSGHGRVMLPGIDAMRSFDQVRVARPESDVLRKRLYRLPITGSGAYELPDGTSIFLEIRPITALHSARAEKCRYNEGAIQLPNGVWPEGLSLRGWRPGDAYRPVGAQTVKKIKDLFQEARIPLWERRYWPVLEAGEQLLWVRQFGAAEGTEADPGARWLLSWRDGKTRPAESLGSSAASL